MGGSSQFVPHQADDEAVPSGSGTGWEIHAAHDAAAPSGFPPTRSGQPIVGTVLISAGLVGLVLTAIFAVTSALPLRGSTRVDAQRIGYEEYLWCHYEWSGEPRPGSNEEPEYAAGPCLHGSPMGPMQVFVSPQGYVWGSWQAIAIFVFGPVGVALMMPLGLLLAGFLVRRVHRSRTG